MRIRLLFVAVLTAFALLPNAASAHVVPQDCQGGFLVGFNTQRGVWIDGIGAICRPWDSFSQTLGTDDNKQVLANMLGGNPQRVKCPDGFAVVAFEYWLPTINGQKVAEHLTLTCQNVKWPHNGSTKQPRVDTTGDERSDNEDSGLYPGAGLSAVSTHMPIESCDTGQIATGFDADVGDSVGQLHIHCGPWPNERPAAQRYQPGLPEHALTPPSVESSWSQSARHRIGAEVPPDILVEGTWQTNLGAMTFSQNRSRVTGTYPVGTVSGVLNNGVLTGSWVQANSDHPCTLQPGLGRFYGPFSFTFSNQNRHFSGTWSYCQGAGGGSWTGDRTD